MARLSRVVAITGTDTEVGKTIVCAGLAALARHHGIRVAVVKPAQTGVAAYEPGDLEVVRTLSGVDDLHELVRYPEPLAPGTAARRAEVTGLEVDEMSAAIRALGDRDVVLVEGAGGLLVELDRSGGTLADLAAQLSAPVLVVARAGLGTLNATALTCGALRSRKLTCPGVIMGAWPADPDLAARCNLEDLPAYAGVPLLGRLPAVAGELTGPEFLEVCLAELGPALHAVLSPAPADV